MDYLTIPAEDIWKIEPIMTVIGGEVGYIRPFGSAERTASLASDGVYRGLQGIFPSKELTQTTS